MYELKHIARLLAFVCVCACTISPLHLLAQNGQKISGKILDDKGSPVAGATVEVKGTKTQTSSSADGTFSVNATTQNTLIITSVGYAKQEVPASGSFMNIALKLNASDLSDVVVVGYGTRKKTDVTSSISSVSGEKMRSVPTVNVTQALQGRVTGLEVAASSFRPGAGARIRIRGNRSLNAGNDPLYVVDGMPVSYTIDDMNPLDIESVDILKDASATAIYGVRGANGVIQITTKKGKAGKINIDYSGSYSFDDVIRPQPVFNSEQLTDAWRQAFFADKQYNYAQSTASPNLYFPDAASDVKMFLLLGNQNQWNSIKDAYNWRVFDRTNNIYLAEKRATTDEEKALLKNLGLAVLDSVDKYDPTKLKSYDWAGQGLRQGHTMSHAISVTAGSDRLRTSFSGSYLKQTGIEYGFDYTRFSVANSNEFRINKAITIGNSINYMYTVQNASTSSYANALGMIPMAPAYDSTGKFILFPNGDQQIPSAINDRNTVFDQTTTNRVLGNVFVEITILKGLKFRTMFGLDSRNSARGTFNGAQSSIRLGSPANGSRTTSNSSSWVYDNILTYSTNIKSNHSLNVTLLQEMQKLNRTDTTTLSANNLIFEQQKWYSLNRNTLATVTGGGIYSAQQLLSFMGRIEYGYKNKYMLTVSNRYDNSSVLSEGNKGANFPAASFAWRVSNEDFFNNQNVLSQAKLRVGIGTVGNSSIDPYQTSGPLTFTNYNWGNGTAAIGSAPLTFPAPTLGWEKTTTTNIGIDFGFLRNRITGSIDLYKTNTKDMLQRQIIPATNGVQYILTNLGKVENKGVEVSLSTLNIQNNNNGFTWSTDFVFSMNKEAIRDIDGSGNNNMANLWILGQPIQVYYNYKKAGIFQYSDTTKGGALADYYWKKAGNRSQSAYSPGRIKIQDTNGDTLMNADDKVVLGSHNPTWTGSIGNTFTYKNFELNFLIYFRMGGLYRVPRPGLVGRYQSSEVNYWTPTNPSNDYQQPTRTTDVPVFWEALTYRDASYARVKNISLTYRIPTHILAKIHANALSVYVNAVNPILIHNASPYDPETVPYRETFVTSTNQVGPTSYSYRSYVVGVRLGL